MVLQDFQARSICINIMGLFGHDTKQTIMPWRNKSISDCCHR